MEDLIGDSSAMALGYIMGDVKGAYTAHKLYGKYKKMYGDKKRKYSSDSTGSATSGRTRKFNTNRSVMFERRPSTSSTISAGSARSSSRRSSVSLRSSRSDRSVASRGSNFSAAKKGKKRVKSLHKGTGNKKVKVSKKLRAKVKKVIEGNDPKGYYQSVNTGILSKPGDSYQSVSVVGAQTFDTFNGLFFSPTQINNAASILWNRKTPNWGSSTNYNDSSNFNWNNARINVIKQWATIKMKNNSQRNYSVAIWTCVNKVKRVAVDPLTEWQSAITEDIAANVSQAPMTSSILYNTPYLSKSWSNNWSAEVKKIFLKPGEEYVHTISGPSKLYDFRKYWAGSTAYTMLKGDVGLMMISQLDLCGCATSGYGRAAEAGGQGYGVVYETNYYCKLEVPEQAGIAWLTTPTGVTASEPLPATGTVTNLGEKSDRYYIDVYRPTLAGNQVNINIENPISSITNPQ